MNKIWNFISDIGLRQDMSAIESRSLRLFNRNIFLVWVTFLTLLIISYILKSSETRIDLINLKIGLLSFFIFLCYLLNASGFFNLGRIVFILGGPLVQMLPNVILQIPMLFPYILMNGIFIFMLVEVLIIYIFDRPNWGVARKLFYTLFLFSFLDYWLVPILFGTPATSVDRYYILKSTLILSMVALLFLASVLKEVIGGLLDLNEQTMKSFEEKRAFLLKKEAEINAKIDRLNIDKINH